MQRLTTCLALTIGLLWLTPAFAQSDNPFSFKWDDGFKIESADKNFKFNFGGRIMWDNAFFFQDDSLEADFGERKNGNEFRRVRLYHSGTVYRVVGYKLQLEFAGGGVVFKDVYMTFMKIPGIGNIRVGHFKEPFRLNALTSSKYNTFMERSYAEAFAPERNVGVMLFNDFLDKRLSAQAGVFRNANKAGDDEQADGGYNLTMRVTGAPVKVDGGKTLVHLGVAYTHRNPTTETYKVSARPEAHLAPKYISTGTLEGVRNIDAVNAEAAVVLGPLSLQGEYALADVKQNLVDVPGEEPNLQFHRYYAQVSYFLTGEHRKMKSSTSGWGRLKPAKNLGKDGGAGAWELAFRVSGINLNDDSVTGGKQLGLTAGLNWYLNPVSRLMVNYNFADIQDEGKVHILQTRIQIDF